MASSGPSYAWPEIDVSYLPRSPEVTIADWTDARSLGSFRNSIAREKGQVRATATRASDGRIAFVNAD